MTDRETAVSKDKKLTCLAIALAVLSQAMMFAIIYVNASNPSQVQALKEALNFCENVTRRQDRVLTNCERPDKHRNTI
jgi:hypothetical protein